MGDEEYEGGGHGPRRRKSDFAVISLVVGLIFPVSGLIWQGAKLDSTVDQLQAISERFEARAQEEQAWKQMIQERIRVLELQQELDDKWTEDHQGRHLQERTGT